MKKMVNGKLVEMTKQDIAEYNAIQQEWKDNALERNKRLYSQALQRHIDNTAQQKEFTSGVSCASYANSIDQNWKQEALDFIRWRDQCWLYAIDVQSKVEAGTIDAPSLDQFIADAPELVWSV